MKKINILSKAEMRRVTGGLVDVSGSCSATCGDKEDALCSGAGCQATDGTGCVGSDASGNPTSVSCANQPLKKTVE